MARLDGQWRCGLMWRGAVVAVGPPKGAGSRAAGVMLVEENVPILKLHELTKLFPSAIAERALKRGFPLLVKLRNNYVFWSPRPLPIPEQAERCPCDDPYTGGLSRRRRQSEHDGQQTEDPHFRVDAWKDALFWRSTMEEHIRSGVLRRHAVWVARSSAVSGIDHCDRVRIASVSRYPLTEQPSPSPEKYPTWHEDPQLIASQIRSFTDNGAWGEYGIRVLPDENHDPVDVAVGEVLDDLYHGPGEGPEGAVTTIGVRRDATTEEILEAMKLFVSYGSTGSTVVLVGAHHAKAGTELGERILARPEVLKIWDCRLLWPAVEAKKWNGLLLNRDGTPGVVFPTADLMVPYEFAVELGYKRPPDTTAAGNVDRNVRPADADPANPSIPKRTADAESTKDLILIASLAAAAAVVTRTLERGQSPKFSGVAAAVRSRLPPGYAGKNRPKGFKGRQRREERPKPGFSLRTLRVSLGMVYQAFMASDSRDLPHKVILIGQLTHMVACPDGTFKDNSEPASKVMAEAVLKGLPHHVKATSKCTAAELCALLERARKKHEGARRARL